MSKVLTFKNIWTKRRIVGTLLVLFFLLSSIIALVTYYGLNVGSFTISVADDVRDSEIFISWNKNEIDSTRLVGKAMVKAQPQSLNGIKTSYVRNTCSEDGKYGEYIANNNAYIGYTYFVKNNSATQAVELDVSMNIQGKNSRSNKTSANEVVWVWYFAESTSKSEDDMTDSEKKLATNGEIYHLKDASSTDASTEQYKIYNNDGYEINEYLDDTTVFSSKKNDSGNSNQNTIRLEPGESYKCTIILWVEQFDPDGINSTTDDLKGAKAKFNIQYTIHSSESE